MPGGFNDPVTGFATFGAIKLLGYSAAAWLLHKRYERPRAPVLVVGVTRTVLGMAVGFFFAAGLELVIHKNLIPLAPVFFYIAGLCLLRIMEWWAIIWFFYDHDLVHKKKDWGHVAGGVAWSFLLDVPAVMGLLATGGLSIC